MADLFGQAAKKITDTIGSFDPTPEALDALTATAHMGSIGRNGSAQAASRADEARRNFEMASAQASMGGTFGDVNAASEQVRSSAPSVPYRNERYFPTPEPTYRDPQEVLFEAIMGPAFDTTTPISSLEELQFRREVLQTLQGFKQQQEEERIRQVLQPYQLAQQLGAQVDVPPELLAEATGLPISVFQTTPADDRLTRLQDLQQERAIDSQVAMVLTDDLQIPSVAAGRGGMLADSDPTRSAGDWARVVASGALGPLGTVAGLRTTSTGDVADYEDIQTYVTAKENSEAQRQLDAALLEMVKSGRPASEISQLINETAALAEDAPRGWSIWMMNRWLPLVSERNQRVKEFEAGG